MAHGGVRTPYLRLTSHQCGTRGYNRCDAASFPCRPTPSPPPHSAHLWRPLVRLNGSEELLGAGHVLLGLGAHLRGDLVALVQRVAEDVGEQLPVRQVEALEQQVQVDEAQVGGQARKLVLRGGGCNLLYSLCEASSGPPGFRRRGFGPFICRQHIVSTPSIPSIAQPRHGFDSDGLK